MGAKESDAVSEEEGADAVRLLTIHAAKGLEFKVVVVADAGRSGRPSRTSSPLRRPVRLQGRPPGDGDAGRDRVVPRREGAPRPRGAGRAAAPLLRRDDPRDGAAHRLRLDRAGRRRQRRDADRLGARPARPRRAGADGRPGGAGRDRPRGGHGRPAPRPRTRRAAGRAGAARARRRSPSPSRASSPSSRARARRCRRPRRGCASSRRSPSRPVTGVARLSYSAISLFDRCSYRYYAERVAGMKPAPWAAGDGDGGGGLHPTEIGDAVHRLLERVDLAAPAAPESSRDDRPRLVPGRHRRRARPDRGARARRTAPRRSPRGSRRSRARGSSGRSRSSSTASCSTAASTSSGAQGPRALVLDYKTNVLGDRLPAEIVEAEYRAQRIVYALACLRAGADEVEVRLPVPRAPDDVVSASFSQADVAAPRARARRRDRADPRGRVPPTPSAFACAGCPALDRVCAGPALAGAVDGAFAYDPSLEPDDD